MTEGAKTGTPRTDAFHQKILNPTPGSYFNMPPHGSYGDALEFGRTLERELSAKQAEVERLTALKEHWQDGRMAGRQEMLSELIRISPEAFDNYSDASADQTGEYTSFWKLEELRNIFHCDEQEGPYERIEGYYWDALGQGDEARSRLRDANDELESLKAAQGQVLEAFDPNVMKPILIGEFKQQVLTHDEEGEECYQDIFIHWDVIKQIMRAIKEHALPTPPVERSVEGE